jgi:hypothetical protein
MLSLDLPSSPLSPFPFTPHPCRAVLDAMGMDAEFAEDVRPLLSIIGHFSAALRAEERVRALAHARTGSAGAAEVEALAKEQKQKQQEQDVEQGRAGAGGGASATPSQDASSSSDAGGSSSSSSSSSVSSIVSAVSVLWQEDEVKKTLLEAVKTWSGEDRDRAAEVADGLATQRFTYSEDRQPEVFFVPYVWTLVYHFSKGDLLWDKGAFKIFTSPSGAPPLYLVAGSPSNGSGGGSGTAAAGTGGASESTGAAASATGDASASASASAPGHQQQQQPHSPLTHTGGGHGFDAQKR